MTVKLKALIACGLIALLIGLGGISATYFYFSHQVPRVYNLTIETEDLRVNDIELVAYGNTLYTSDHHFLM